LEVIVRRVIFISGLVLVLAACAEYPTPNLTTPNAAATAAKPTEAPVPTFTPIPTETIAASGIEGVILMGPACPVEQENVPCPDYPVEATLAVLDAAEATLAEIKSDVQGYFRIELPPGTYTLQPKPLNAIQRGAPQSVTVTAGQFISVTVTYDSGLR
jgi:hypothetical protein